MSTTIERSSQSDPTYALQLSQQANSVLSRPAPASKFFPLSLLTASETPDSWTDLERLFAACLRTGDDESAHLCLERLTQRFGPSDVRVMGLRGLYQEAIAKGPEDLERILAEYEDVLSEDPMNVALIKRRVALLRSMRRPADATEALAGYLESSPTDAEAWAELSDLYQSQGMSTQAIFSLEEALLIVPNAWNLHARLGEVECIVASSGSEGAEASYALLAEAVRRFSRSIELCDDYLRGYYGLKIATRKLLDKSLPAKSSISNGPSRENIQRLNELATKNLDKMVRSWSDQDSPASKQSEIIAAKELLNR